MWIYTSEGFVAIARFNPNKPGAREFLEQMGDSGGGGPLYLLRARRRRHLEDFNRAGKRPIIYMHHADYPWRTLVRDADLMRNFGAYIGRQLHYDSLKAAVKEGDDLDYYSTLYGVWDETLAGLDERAWGTWAAHFEDEEERVDG